MNCKMSRLSKILDICLFRLCYNTTTTTPTTNNNVSTQRIEFPHEKFCSIVEFVTVQHKEKAVNLFFIF